MRIVYPDRSSQTLPRIIDPELHKKAPGYIAQGVLNNKNGYLLRINADGTVDGTRDNGSSFGKFDLDCTRSCIFSARKLLNTHKLHAQRSNWAFIDTLENIGGAGATHQSAEHEYAVSFFSLSQAVIERLERMTGTAARGMERNEQKTFKICFRPSSPFCARSVHHSEVGFWLGLVLGFCEGFQLFFSQSLPL